ncbi:hypothetical protein ACFY05_19840 [Microtetraspora fusca]|uniref:Uncharacterized protein n=1 Tax=Microtetraspora fusca TaxID=1997 RepID=A0ABW6V7H4_MICFU
MITRIEIDGFTSFADFALDVPPFLVLIGTNASGTCFSGRGRRHQRIAEGARLPAMVE